MDTRLDAAQTESQKAATRRNLDRAIRKLPPLPTAVPEIVRLMRERDQDIGLLQERISADPSLATRLLRMANSSFYSVQTEIVSVSRALMTLGFRTSVNVILAASVRSSFSDVGYVPGMVPHGAFHHSVATAACVSLMGKHLPALRAHADKLFACGLLHDIGKIALSPLYTTHREALESIGNVTPRDERRLLGVDHLEVGALVVEHWKLPAEFVAPITRHHDPVESLRDELPTLAVAAADLFLNQAGHARLAPAPAGGDLDAALQLLGVEPKRFEALLAGFEDEARTLLGAVA